VWTSLLDLRSSRGVHDLLPAESELQLSQALLLRLHTRQELLLLGLQPLHLRHTGCSLLRQPRGGDGVLLLETTIKVQRLTVPLVGCR
jgi:hypothetical protein